jgi:hypothetical protein
MVDRFGDRWLLCRHLKISDVQLDSHLTDLHDGRQLTVDHQQRANHEGNPLFISSGIDHHEIGLTGKDIYRSLQIIWDTFFP